MRASWNVVLAWLRRATTARVEVAEVIGGGGGQRDGKMWVRSPSDGWWEPARPSGAAVARSGCGRALADRRSHVRGPAIALGGELGGQRALTGVEVHTGDGFRRGTV